MTNTRSNHEKLVKRNQKEIREWVAYLEKNVGQEVPVQLYAQAISEAYLMGNLSKSKTERRWQVTMLIISKNVEYSSLVNRALARAKAEFPQECLTDEISPKLVSRSVFEAVSERSNVLANAPVWLDTFNDVIWTRVKRSVSQALGVECEIDEGAYQNWINSEDWKRQL